MTDDKVIKEVGDFVYLGAMFSNKGGTNKDMQN